LQGEGEGGVGTRREGGEGGSTAHASASACGHP